MRDGVELLADHYRPDRAPNHAPIGTVLLRGPYGRGIAVSAISAALYAARGYHVILQSVRGTFGSGGVFEPMINEAQDGADTAAWLRRQPWFTGRFATVGASYLGFTQWALLADPPPELAAAVITAGPHDFSTSSWGTGSFTIHDFLGWSALMARQQDRGAVRALLRAATARRRLTQTIRAVPLGAAGRALLGAGAPWYESWLQHPDLDDPFWQPMQLGAALDRVQVPVLLITGWQDLFLSQTLEQYRRLRGRDVQVALTIGPWTHAQLFTQGLSVNTRESLAWLDAHLAGTRPARRPSPVRVHVAGAGWQQLPDWPLPTSQRALYLQPGRGLAETPPAPETRSAPPADFRYDPTDPTPTIGGPLLGREGGYRCDSGLARRADVLSFTSAPLGEDLYVHGNPIVELAHSSDTPHIDLFVRVSEVDLAEKSRNVSDGYRRLTDSTGPVRIELDAVAHRFKAGSRIRLLIAGGSHPRYARNLGTGEPQLTGITLKPTTHTVDFGGSRLLLPVGSPVPSACV